MVGTDSTPSQTSSKNGDRVEPVPTGSKKTHRSVDLLGRIYEYFLNRFASAEGKNGGQFYIPSCVVRCLVG